VASKVKKQGSEAMASLKKWVRRDGRLTAWVADVAAWIADMRKTQANLKADNERLEKAAEAARSRNDATSAKLDEANERAASLQNELTNLQGLYATAMKYNDNLIKIVEDPADIDTEGMDLPAKMIDEAGYKTILKSLMRAYPKPPSPTGSLPSKKTVMFNAVDLVQDPGSFALLGQFVVAVTIAGMTVGFFSTAKLTDTASMELQLKYTRWTRGWVEKRAEWQEAVYAAMPLYKGINTKSN
jgi:Sec-independent protein translocase protein TatA